MARSKAPRFIVCEAPEGSSLSQRAYEWLYICEGPVKVGDVVRADFGYNTNSYMKVLRVGKTREEVGSDYTGAIKVIKAVVSAYEKALVDEIDELEVELRAAKRSLRHFYSAKPGCACVYDDCLTCNKTY